MEAGNRCFDQRVPEEINRKIVDHLSDINMPYSTISREYLLREGIPPEWVIKTGSPMYEVLHHYRPKIDASDVLRRLNLRTENYYLVSSHREENIEYPEQFDRLIYLLNGLVDHFGKRVIVSTHPRTRKVIEERRVGLRSEIELMKPLGFFDYVHLEMNAIATLSDSGTISEESSILNFPALNIRNAHERPEAMEEGAVMLTSMEFDRIAEGLKILQSQGRKGTRTLLPVQDYQAPNVSEKVIRVIISYVDYVNHFVWHKP